MLVPLPNFGKFGVISDTLNASLPIGTWSDARNMRFSGIQMEKMLEPTLSFPFDADALGEPLWMQGWSDGTSTYVVVATQTNLFFLQRAAEDETGSWISVTREEGPYSVDGIWDSFSWGDTCIFNNGVEPPQIFSLDTLRFEDLPKWGLISTAQDIVDAGPLGVPVPSRDVYPSCKIIKPYRNLLVAFGITEAGVYQPNTVWWSDVTTLSTFSTTRFAGGGPPSWDYESPATISAKSEVGVGYGAINCAAQLNENMVIYTDSSATNMQFVGGSFVMSFRRLFNKGAAGQKCACEFNNQHFVVARDQIYLHDGSTVQLIAKDRVEEDFFRRIGKKGRFGGTDTVYWEGVQVVQNPDRKEIYVIYSTPDQEEPVIELPLEARADLIYSSAIAWNGYHDGFGMVCTDPTGEYLMFSHKGYGRLQFSADGGDNFTETNTIADLSAANNADWPIPSFKWNPFLEHFQGLIVRTETRGNFWGPFDPDGAATWGDQNPSPAAAQGQYNRSFWIDPSDGEVYRSSGGSPNPLTVHKGIPSVGSQSFSTSPFPGGSTIHEISPGVLFVGNSAEGGGSATKVRLIAKTLDTEQLFYGDVFGDVHRTACRGQGVVLGMRLVAGSIVTLDKLVYTGTVSPTLLVEIDFGVNLAFADLCYSPELDGYVVVARDADDTRLLHIRYCVGDNTDTWKLVDSVYTQGYMTTNNNRQIYHSHDDVYYWAYLQQIGSSQCSTLERITLNVAPDDEDTVVTLALNHFDNYSGGVYISDIGPNIGAASLAPSANAKFGATAMGFNNSNRGGFGTAPDIDPNNCTIEMQYRPGNFTQNSGLFQFGDLGQETIVLRAYVGTGGGINFAYLSNTPTAPFTLSAPAGTIPNVDEYYELCFEVERKARTARIYVNGTPVVTASVERTQWTGLPEFYVGYARISSQDRSVRGNIDEIRISQGARYKGENYDPHTAAFTD